LDQIGPAPCWSFVCLVSLPETDPSLSTPTVWTSDLGDVGVSSTTAVVLVYVHFVTNSLLEPSFSPAALKFTETIAQTMNSGSFDEDAKKHPNSFRCIH
jgi:hypothetical protein